MVAAGRPVAVSATSAEAEAGEDAEGSEEDEKPKNALRQVRKKAYGDKEEFLRYSILASKTALCREDA